MITQKDILRKLLHQYVELIADNYNEDTKISVNVDKINTNYWDFETQTKVYGPDVYQKIEIIAIFPNNIDKSLVPYRK